jgi:hypothetical protein
MVELTWQADWYRALRALDFWQLKGRTVKIPSSECVPGERVIFATFKEGAYERAGAC